MPMLPKFDYKELYEEIKAKNEANVEIIKGLLKWIKKEGIEWNEELDLIFKPKDKNEN
jgi:hypothetical protein